MPHKMTIVRVTLPKGEESISWTNIDTAPDAEFIVLQRRRCTLTNTEEGFTWRKPMNSCFFAGMTNYFAHPLSTDDVDERFSFIAAAVGDSERQFDLVADFEKKADFEHVVADVCKVVKHERHRCYQWRAHGFCR